MKPADLTLNDLKIIQEKTMLPDAFISAYNVIFDTNVEHINQIKLNDITAETINEIFNNWLLFFFNTYLLEELQKSGNFPELENIQTFSIHRNYFINDIISQDQIAQIMRQKLSGYELCNFYNIFLITLAEWEYKRIQRIKTAYHNNRKKNARVSHINAIFTTPKRQDQTLKRAFKSISGVSVAEVISSAIFLLLKEQIDTVDYNVKQLISCEINKLTKYICSYKKYQSAAKESHKNTKNDSYKLNN